MSVHPSYAGGANAISLNEARKNYLLIGAIEPCVKDSVRSPFPDELQ